MLPPSSVLKTAVNFIPDYTISHPKEEFYFVNINLLLGYLSNVLSCGDIGQCFSTFVRPRPGKFFFYKKRAQSQQIYS